MAVRLQRFASRLITANQPFCSGRWISTTTAMNNALISRQKSHLFGAQSALLENTKHFTKCCSFPNKQIAYSTQANDQSSSEGASEERLSYVYEILRENVPMFFVQPLDYSLCDKNIVFENRIRGKTYIGIFNYVKHMSFLRLYGHFKYAHVKMEVLKITKHPEDSTIKIRWRITDITGYRILLKMLQFRVWEPKKMIEKHSRPWVDGFSTIYVNKEGRIYRHIADKVMPDEDKKTNPLENIVNKLKDSGTPKIALFVELSTNCSQVIS